VIWRRPVDSQQRPGMGLQFLKLDRDAAQWLEQYVYERAAGLESRRRSAEAARGTRQRVASSSSLSSSWMSVATSTWCERPFTIASVWSPCFTTVARRVRTRSPCL